MRLYTLEEARAILPDAIVAVTHLRDAISELRTVRAAIAAHQRGASGDGNLLADPWASGEGNRVQELETEIRRSAAYLEQRGIEVKDPERGLIDFYSEREGRVVYLCYLLGEPDIEYWHELHGGFAGRQAL